MVSVFWFFKFGVKYALGLGIFAVPQQKSYHPLFPFIQQIGQKKRKLFPFSCFVCFVFATPYTQVLHNVVNFPVLDTLSV